MKRLKFTALSLLLLLLTACGGGERAPGLSGREPVGSMDLRYATQFSVDYYEGGYAEISIGEDRFLLVPEGAPVPEDAEIPVLVQPLTDIYLASSSVMDLFLRLDALDAVTMTSTSAESWTIPEIAEAVRTDEILYVGKYSAPDYEVVLDMNCHLAVENTMIYHSPETKEKLEALNIPVLVERSSYEPEPMGRVEWIKLYGLLTGRLEQAEAFFDQSVRKITEAGAGENTGKTAAFFYFTANGSVNVRKPGDYIVRMIELAGGNYALKDLESDDSGATSSMNMEPEAFYAGAKDADVLIYNSTVDGGAESLADLLKRAPMLADFRAVQNGNVFCTEQNLFQQVSGTADMISDLRAVFSEDSERSLTYLYRLE